MKIFIFAIAMMVFSTVGAVMCNTTFGQCLISSSTDTVSPGDIPELNLDNVDTQNYEGAFMTGTSWYNSFIQVTAVLKGAAAPGSVLEEFVLKGFGLAVPSAFAILLNAIARFSYLAAAIQILRGTVWEKPE